MAKLLRVALLGDKDPNDNEPMVEMQGPLAEVFRKALNVAYANPDPITNKPVLESQAQDAQIAKMVADALQIEEDRGLQPITVYGVSRTDATGEDLVAVAQNIAPDNQDGIFVLVTDMTQPGPNGEVGGGGESAISLAMESMVQALGGHVVHSLEELKTLCKKGFA